MIETIKKLIAQMEEETKVKPTPFLSVARGALHLALNNMTEHEKQPMPEKPKPEAGRSATSTTAPKAA